MNEEASRRFRIEPTIRIGDMLTASVIAVTVLGAWFNLSGTVERNAEVQKLRDQSQDSTMADFKQRVGENIVQIHQEVAETRQDVKELSRFMRGTRSGGG